MVNFIWFSDEKLFTIAAPPALCYGSPIAAEREITPVTVERSVVLNEERSAADAVSRSTQRQSL